MGRILYRSLVARNENLVVVRTFLGVASAPLVQVPFSRFRTNRKSDTVHAVVSAANTSPTPRVASTALEREQPPVDLVEFLETRERVIFIRL